MRGYQRIALLFLAGVFVVGATALAALRNQQDKSKKREPKKSSQMIEAESKLPVANYDASDLADPKKQQERLAKGKKYEKTELTIDPSADVVSSSEHWASGLSSIPTDKSDVIIVGNVINAQAFTTQSKKRVYSEFTVQVDEVFKDDINNPIQANASIEVDRIGGRVQFSDGKVGQYFVVGQGMPQVGKQYLLFLTKSEEKRDYNILTGYEIRGGFIYLLDNPGSGHPITKVNGSDAASFLDEVRTSISNRNEDGVIDRRDAVFDSLRLWRDANHDGVSEACELQGLPQLGLKSIDLDYKVSNRRDQYGNWFRYRAKVRDVRGAQLGRWAWDIFLVRRQ